MRKSAAKEILRVLFNGTTTLGVLESKTGFLSHKLEPVLEEMVKLNVLKFDRGFYEIHCVCKRPKITYTVMNSNFDTVYGYYERRKAMERVKKSERHHSGARGDEKVWKRIASEALGKPDEHGLKVDAAMDLFNLIILPTVRELNRVRRKAMQEAHPDRGGTVERAQEINAAYEILKAEIE